MTHSKYYYDYDRNDPNRISPFPAVENPGDQSFWETDGIDLTGNPMSDSGTISSFRGSSLKASSPEDAIPTITNENGFWKYNEDVIMKEIREYLGGTYKAHYSNDNQTQTLDLIDSIGDAEAFCRSNAIKYLSRFGKKDGKSKLDILKAIHYCILLTHFSGVIDQKGNYETF